MLRTSFTTREGHTVFCDYTDESAARRRLAFLEEDEKATQRVAPTDSGNTRFNYTAEANAIKQLLFT